MGRVTLMNRAVGAPSSQIWPLPLGDAQGWYEMTPLALPRFDGIAMNYKPKVYHIEVMSNSSTINSSANAPVL